MNSLNVKLFSLLYSFEPEDPRQAFSSLEETIFQIEYNHHYSHHHHLCHCLKTQIEKQFYQCNSFCETGVKHHLNYFHSLFSIVFLFEPKLNFHLFLVCWVLWYEWLLTYVKCLFYVYWVFFFKNSINVVNYTDWF